MGLGRLGKGRGREGKGRGGEEGGEGRGGEVESIENMLYQSILDW